MRPFLLACLGLVVSGCQAPEYDDPPATTSLAEVPAEEVRLPAQPLLAAELSPFERALGDRMRAVAETTVEVEMWSGEDLVGHGSGVLVSKDGDVLTAAHVAKDPRLDLRVVLADGQHRRAVVAARDEAHDAALLHAPGAATAFLRPRAEPLEPGGWVICAGHGGEVPGERVPMRSAGVVVQRGFAWTVTEYEGPARHRRAAKTTTFPGMLALDCATAPGMSGGPVVDLDGDLVGVVVGSGGVASSIEAIRHLLPAASRAREVTPPRSPPAASPPLRRSEGRPSRAATLEPMFASPGVERSLLVLHVDGGIGVSRFDAVLVSTDGLAVAPALPLQGMTELDDRTVRANITVEGHPGARCAEVVAVEGEVALIRIAGLPPLAPEERDTSPGGLRPVGPPGTAALGEYVAAVSPRGRAFGFVTALDRHPGTVQPDPPTWGCGTLRMRFQRSHPPVTVTSALTHDAGGWTEPGSVLVDRSGRPVAIVVAERAPGLGFAVPWSEVVDRFQAWLDPS